jgi:hypothetical protein
MLALSLAEGPGLSALCEGFAQALLSFLPTSLPASIQNSLTPIIPTLAHLPANPNYSRTYAIPGGSLFY